MYCGAIAALTCQHPLIGPVPDIPNCYVVMGFGGNGITYSVIASQVVAAAIRGQPDPDARLYAL
jgi:glycine/D-amino acid oxidase-like deaminating enzyme